MKYKKSNIITLQSGAQRQPIYYYHCTSCGKKRQTIYKGKAEIVGVCGSCRAKGIVNKNQMQLPIDNLTQRGGEKINDRTNTAS